jgi:hypothetical protein
MLRAKPAPRAGWLRRPLAAPGTGIRVGTEATITRRPTLVHPPSPLAPAYLRRNGSYFQVAMPTFRLQLSAAADELVELDVGGRPSKVTRYSVVLRHLDRQGNATAVRVYDNSHQDVHHMHRCDRDGRRQQPPEIFTTGGG